MAPTLEDEEETSEDDEIAEHSGSELLPRRDRKSIRREFSLAGLLLALTAAATAICSQLVPKTTSPSALASSVQLDFQLDLQLDLFTPELFTPDSWSAKPVSLFCLFVIQPPPSYEHPVSKYLFKKRISIFQCDAWRIYSDKWSDPIVLGRWPNGSEAKSIPIPGPPAYMCNICWGGNANCKPYFCNGNTFKRAFDKIFEEGIYKKYDFTVKVDPDTVFMPAMLRSQLQAFGHLDKPDKPPGKIF